MKIVFTPALMSLRSSAEAGVTTEAGSDSGYTTSTERLSLTWDENNTYYWFSWREAALEVLMSVCDQVEILACIKVLEG